MISKKAISTLLLVSGFTLYLTVSDPKSAYAMHIMEGFLPYGWAIFWWAVFIPFFILGLRSLMRITRETPELKIMLGVAGAFILVLSALKIPSVTGSSSHPTGTGLGAVMFGPLPMSVLGSIVLLFQALLLAHGGLTTLGANAFSMAVAGPMIGYAAYRWMIKSTGKQTLSIFTAAALANLSTYVVTSIQLALAFPAESGGILASFVKFGGIFAITQIPLAISEGLLTVLIWNWLKANSSEELSILQRKMKGA
ncbi:MULTISPECIES: energy-coupling factor ABC transporter permease [Paenibacillus]|uniref:Cobalt transport protein CbiM n=1 Tax=Paenibacillus naphthalenovorans TaxID=162209 RepID=A0A0U2W5A2_9BACL|nr:MULTISPECIES: energy-coupling factor ABC transporter permease [Paenibacillus]ALS20602.1 cobalt transporter CbiM [Paenibacillus naphthalenovorans]GCL73162.1 energy-coupling factor ABC transporter permease [Paenibacillus naphthalenovorans]